MVIASVGIFLSLLYFWGRIQPVGEEVLYLFGYFVLAVICGFALFDSAFSRMWNSQMIMLGGVVMSDYDEYKDKKREEEEKKKR